MSQPFRCDCREARLLRAIGTGQIPAPDDPMWTALIEFIEASAVRRLRAVSHGLSGSAADGSVSYWSRLSRRPNHDELQRRRNAYDTPARTPEEIRRQTVASWAEFMREAA